MVVAEPRGRAEDAQDRRRRANSPCYKDDGAETATSCGSENARAIKAKHRVRFCADHMKTQNCQREVNGSKCVKGLHCTSEEADLKKEAAKAAVKAELAARKAAGK